jgi:hypothetical protein
MTTTLRTLAATAAIALGAATTVLIGAPPAGAATAGGPQLVTHTAGAPGLPQTLSARAGASWLAAQFVPAGYIPSTTTPGQPDLSDTAQAVLAMAAANTGMAQARAGFAYLAGNIDADVDSGGSDSPGALAFLILDAHVLGDNPTDVDGTNLVARLLATMTPSGQDTGLFGSSYSGVYGQGLALIALAAAGVAGASVAPAIAWLENQACAGGGWEYYRADTTVACSPSDINGGADTNDAALAIEALTAQGASVPGTELAYFTATQDADGGWPYQPGDGTDADSTSLVLQALVAMHVTANDPTFVHGGDNPVDALLALQQTSGTGGFAYQPNGDGSLTVDLLATEQAVPAAAGLALPFSPTPAGYVVAGANGGVFAFGGAHFAGSLPALAVSVSNIVGLATTPDGLGYWMAASDGGVFALGDAPYFGSMGGKPLNKPIVAMAATPDGKGYWLVASDGGLFAFGDAGYYGSMGGKSLNKPIVAVAATPDGKGYWLVASDGGLFAFGDAGFFGSMGGKHLNKPVVAMAATPDGKGYWLVASDGGLFAFGDAGYYGSTGGITLAQPIVGMAATTAVGGYRMVAADGGVFCFGDAPFSGSATSAVPQPPAVALATSGPGIG